MIYFIQTIMNHKILFEYLISLNIWRSNSRLYVKLKILNNCTLVDPWCLDHVKVYWCNIIFGKVIQFLMHTYITSISFISVLLALSLYIYIYFDNCMFQSSYFLRNKLRFWYMRSLLAILSLLSWYSITKFQVIFGSIYIENLK